MTTVRPTAAGQLVDFREGRIRGRIIPDVRMAAFASLTLEIFAQGILFVSAAVPRPGMGAPAGFSISVERFPRLTLPCTLTARVAEIDARLDGEILLETLEDVWGRMMPFRATLRRPVGGRILVEVNATLVASEDQLFAIYDETGYLGAMELQGGEEQQCPVFAFDLPQSLLDGLPHQLSIIHQRSQLPVTAAPVVVQLTIDSKAPDDLRSLAARVKSLEARSRELQADAVNVLAVELYRHIDRLIINQRNNFECEVSAMRALLGLTPQSNTDAQIVPDRLRCEFGAALIGYGLHPAERTSTGKVFRHVASRCGIVLPPLATGAAFLRVQGITRPHDGALNDAMLSINGVVVEAKPYLNPKSESWNLTAEVPAGVLRSERNLLEMRFTQAASRDPAPMDRAVGVLFVEVGPADRPGAAPRAPDGRAGADRTSTDALPNQRSGGSGATDELLSPGQM